MAKHENESSEQKLDRLERENQALRAENTTLRSDGIPPELAEDVKWRMAAGLEKHQAIAVAQAQLEHDKNLGIKR